MKVLRCVSRKFWKRCLTTQVVGNSKEQPGCYTYEVPPNPRSWAMELSPQNWHVTVTFVRNFKKFMEKLKEGG